MLEVLISKDGSYKCFSLCDFWALYYTRAMPIFFFYKQIYRMT